MKRIVLLIILSVACFSINWGAKITVKNSGFLFSPDSININVGDTVVFSLASIHNVLEVTKATWLLNGNTAKDGGFSLPFSGGTHVFTAAGTYYYVCFPHASMGMKGQVVVNLGTGISSTNSRKTDIFVYPNPVKDHVVISYFFDKTTIVSVSLHNSAGIKVVSYSSEKIADGEVSKTYYLPSALTAGVYVIEINVDGVIRPYKIVVTK